MQKIASLWLDVLHAYFMNLTVDGSKTKMANDFYDIINM